MTRAEEDFRLSATDVAVMVMAAGLGTAIGALKMTAEGEESFRVPHTGLVVTTI
jgi:hypothetical protein